MKERFRRARRPGGGAVNNPPFATNVIVTGIYDFGETLTGSYDYFDPDGHPESGSLYQWYRADTIHGLNEEPITGATDITYLIPEADARKFLRFEVTPSDGDRFGTPGVSSWGGPLDITFISFSIMRENALTNTVPAPVDILDDDLLIAVIVNGASSGVTGAVTPPAGFNVALTDATATNSVYIYTKVAASESGDYVFSWVGAGVNTIAILVYRNCNTVNTVGTVARISSSTVTATSIEPTVEGTLLAAFGIEAARDTETGPADMTRRAFHDQSSVSMFVYDLPEQAASATGNKVLLSGGSNAASIGIQFQITRE